jgi:hypothetical protein
MHCLCGAIVGRRVLYIVDPAHMLTRYAAPPRCTHRSSANALSTGTVVP